MTSTDRARGPVVVGVLGLIVAVLCALAAVRLVVQLGFQTIQREYGYVPTVATIWLASGLFAMVVLAVRTRARRGAVRWARGSGGDEDLERDAWPWADQHSRVEDVTILFAVRGLVRGLPVVVAEVKWERDGLGGATVRSSGHGIAAVLTLADPYPDTAVQRRRSSERHAGDPFRGRFRILVGDLSHADWLNSAALREAHVEGDIPPWTIKRGELYTVVPGRYLTGRRAATAVAQLVRVAELAGAVPSQH